MDRHLVVLALTTATFVACGGSTEARRPARSAAVVESRTTTTSAALTTQPAASSSVASSAPVTPARVEPASAVVRVSTTRCDRAQSCGHIGTGRTFGDRDECVNAVGHDVVAELPVADCPTGIDADRLSSCLSELGDGACDGAAKETALPPSCTLDQLCAGR